MIIALRAVCLRFTKLPWGKRVKCIRNFNKTPGRGRHRQIPASTATPLLFIRYLLNPDAVGRRDFKDLKDFYLHDLL